VTYLLQEWTNPSELYHQIRGQSDFKLYSLKIICEIGHTMMITVGIPIFYNFSKNFQLANCQNSSRTKFERIKSRLAGTIFLFAYTIVHSYLLSVEMLITHVVLTLPYSAWFQYVCMNSLCEIKISVFKKCDQKGLFDYANNDAMDRYHCLIYIVSTLLQTSQGKIQIVKQAFSLYAIKCAVDFVKHFYLTFLNKLTLNCFTGMRKDIFRKLHQFQNHTKIEVVPSKNNQAERFQPFSGETDVDIASGKIKWSLLTTDVIDAESALATSRNFTVLP
jgi:hypothetical protein